MQWIQTSISWLQVTRQCSIHHTHTHLLRTVIATYRNIIHHPFLYTMVVIFTLWLCTFTEAVVLQHW